MATIKVISIGGKYYGYSDEKMLNEAALIGGGVIYIGKPFEVTLDTLPVVKGYRYTFNSYGVFGQPRIPKDPKNGSTFPTVEEIMAYVEVQHKDLLSVEQLETLYSKRTVSFTDAKRNNISFHIQPVF